MKQVVYQNYSRSFLRSALALGMVVICAAACSSSGDHSPPRSWRINAKVAADGFDIDAGPVRVSADSPVAPVGTEVSVSSGPEVSPTATPMFRPFDTAPVAVRLGNGAVQPGSPVRLRFDIDPTRVNEQLAKAGALVVLAQDDSGGLDVLPARWDPGSGVLSAESTHLSTFWPGSLDAAAVMKTVSDAISAAAGARFPRPDCVGASAGVGAVTIAASAVDRDVAWPCVSERGGKFEVALQSNSPWVWLVNTQPAATAFEVHGRDLAGALAAWAFYEAGFGKADAASVLVPGDTTTFPYESTTPPTGGRLRVEAGLSLIAVVLTEISATADLLGVKLGLLDDLESHYDKLTCLAGVAEGLNHLSGDDFGARAGALGRAVLDCVGVLGGVAGAVFLGAVATIISALFISLGGLWNTITGQNTASFTVTATRAAVLTDRGFGAIQLGMTVQQVASVLSPIVRDVTYYGRCRVMSNQPDQVWDLSVWINTTKGVVTGIETPPGTVTDRNVGDGSTTAQIRQAYAADHTIEEGTIGGQGSRAIIVRPKNSPDPTRYICFPIKDDGSVGPPSAGRNYASEGC